MTTAIKTSKADRTPSETPSPVNIPQNAPEQPTREPKLLPKTLQAIKLVQAGLTAKQALQATNYKEVISARAQSKLREKCRKYSLTDDSTARLASNQIKRILKARAREEAHKKVTSTGQVVEYIDNIYPTDSNILAAASMVYDRYEPVKSQEQAQGQGNTYIDLSTYQVSIQAQPEAIEAEVINSPLKGL